jgi:hypothetical protein
MTSTDGKRISGGGHRKKTSKSSSEATSNYSVDTPSESPTPSPTMPTVVGNLREAMEDTHLNGTSTSSKNGPRAYLDRKPSSPMMPAFMVSAPGKVIVYGEHAVVHGKVRLCAQTRSSAGTLIKLRNTMMCANFTHIGSNCCCHLSSLISPRHVPLKIKANNYSTIP